jgi:hypothetical protein
VGPRTPGRTDTEREAAFDRLTQARLVRSGLEVGVAAVFRRRGASGSQAVGALHSRRFGMWGFSLQISGDGFAGLPVPITITTDAFVPIPTAP